MNQNGLDNRKDETQESPPKGSADTSGVLEIRIEEIFPRKPIIEIGVEDLLPTGPPRPVPEIQAQIRAQPNNEEAQTPTTQLPQVPHMPVAPASPSVLTMAPPTRNAETLEIAAFAPRQAQPITLDPIVPAPTLQVEPVASARSVLQIPVEEMREAGVNSPLLSVSEEDVTMRAAPPVVVEPIVPRDVLTVEPPALHPMLEIPAHQIPARPDQLLVITDEDVAKPTSIYEPVEGSEVGRRIRVVGEAHPRSQLRLFVDDFQADVWADEQGHFVFEGVPIVAEESHIVVESLTYPRYGRCRTVLKVFRAAKPLLYLGRRDPYTQRPFAPADEVVRCRKGGHFSLAASWAEVPGCAYPACGDHQNWTPKNDQFYEDH